MEKKTEIYTIAKVLFTDKQKFNSIYITRNEADNELAKYGFHSNRRYKYLQKVLPGKAIGGDLYENRSEPKLPDLPINQRYLKYVVNYNGIDNSSDRLVITDNCLSISSLSFINIKKCEMYFFKDHYKSLVKDVDIYQLIHG